MAEDSKQHRAFVLKLDGYYLKFMSYGQAKLARNPLNASLYSRLSDAKYRQKQDVWFKGDLHKGSKPTIILLVVDVAWEAEA